MKQCALCHKQFSNDIYGPYCSWECGDMFDDSASTDLIFKVYAQAKEYDETHYEFKDLE